MYHHIFPRNIFTYFYKIKYIIFQIRKEELDFSSSSFSPITYSIVYRTL